MSKTGEIYFNLENSRYLMSETGNGGDAKWSAVNIKDLSILDGTINDNALEGLGKSCNEAFKNLRNLELI